MAQTDALVDPSNLEQAKAWDGDEGRYWAAHAERFEATVAAYNEPFLDAAAIGTASRVLDIGCGTGSTTIAAARRAPAGSALGLDLSRQMLDVARRTAEREGVANVTFEQADAQVHPFETASFDSAISRTGAMFFGDPSAAFANIARALRPGGTLTLLVWQSLADNEWIREIATILAAGRQRPMPPPEAPGPFSLSDPARVRRLLTGSGFAGVELGGLSAPMLFGRDTEDTFTFVLGLTGWMLDGLDQAGRARALDALRASIEAHQTGDGVLYDSATWLVTARREG